MEIQTRVASIKRLIEEAQNYDEQEHLQNRLAWLTGKVAVVSVGGSTPTGKSTIMHRLDDSIRSAKSSLDDGYVPGGGTAYLMAYNKVKNNVPTDEEVSDSEYSFFMGYEAMCEALLSPFMQILTNAGLSDNEINEIMFGYDNTVDVEEPDFELGLLSQLEAGNKLVYNAINHTIEKVGKLIDSAKVVKTSILKAADIGAVFVTTESVNVNQVTYYQNLKEINAAR